MAASVGNLDTLIALSHTLDERLGRTAPERIEPPGHALLHPRLVEVLSTPSSVWGSQGIALDQVNAFTDKAKGRGFRKSALIFGWHPEGHTYWGVPVYFGEECVVYRFDRHDGLAQTELSLEAFVDALIDETRAMLDKLEDSAHLKPASRPVEERPVEGDAPKKMRTVRVTLPDSDGAVLCAGERREAFSGEELAYVIWSLRALQMLTDEPAPDLSAWRHRALRRVRLDAVPAEDDPKFAEYRRTWLRLSRRDRIAAPDEFGRIAGHKLTEPGEWLLADSERETLILNRKAKAPRHRPNEDQAAIWARFTELCEAGEVAIAVR